MRNYYQILVNNTKIVKCYEDETILVSLHRNNVNDFVYGCFGGGCGKCLIRVNHGAYEITKKMSKEHISKVSNERLLACCIQPRSDMEIMIL